MSDKNNKDINTYNDYRIPSGMLSSPQIEYYQKYYEIIGNYKDSCLGPASYHMRVGGEVLTWHEGQKVEFILGENDDVNLNIRKSVELRPNSLTFLTTVEEFRLPKDIIARFNLKSKWVHQGLLLGTGPIVDPQIHAHLLIPIHNFSSQTVVMNYGQEFISVEFTKTLNPDDELLLSDNKFTRFVQNKSWDFNFKKYRENIANKKVESSVLSQFQENYKQIELSRTTIEKWKTDTNKTIESVKNINIVGLFGVFLAIVAVVLATWQLISSTNEKADATYNLVKEYKGSSIDFRSFALKSSYDDLQKEILDLKRKNELLNNDSSLKSSKSAADFKAMQDRFEQKIKSMELRVEKLEKKLR